MRVVVQRPSLLLMLVGIIFRVPLAKSGLVRDPQQPPPEEVPKIPVKSAETNRSSIPSIPLGLPGRPWLKRAR